MEIPVDRLVEIIVREVLAELARRGVVPSVRTAAQVAPPPAGEGPSLAIDMTGYRTPVLTESRVRAVGRHIREIIVPAGTICTIGARDLMQQRRMKLTFTGNTH